MPTLISCKLDAKASDNAQIVADPNARGQRKISQQETWTVIFDGVVDQLTAMTAAGLPTAGLVYHGLFCTRVNPSRMRESPYAWKVIVDYEQQQPQSGTAGNSIWNLSIKKSSCAREETATRDRLNLPLVNTFGELLPQLPNLTLFDEVWTISWNTSVAPDWGDIDGKTNSDSFTFTICGITRAFTKSQAKVANSGFSTTKIIDSTSGNTKQYKFIYACEISIQIRKPKWVWTAPNEGWRGNSGSVFGGATEVVTFHENDRDRTPKSSPTKMGLSGFALDDGATVLKLPDDAIGKTTPNAGRTYVEDGAFELEKQVAFSPLFSTLHD